MFARGPIEVYNRRHSFDSSSLEETAFAPGVPGSWLAADRGACSPLQARDERVTDGRVYRKAFYPYRAPTGLFTLPDWGGPVVLACVNVSNGGILLPMR